MSRGPRVKYEHPELPNALNWLRSRLRMTQDEVATTAGISKVYYTQLERGTVAAGNPKYPSVQTLESLLKSLSSDWDELDSLLIHRPWSENPELNARSFRMRAATPKPALYDGAKAMRLASLAGAAASADPAAQSLSALAPRTPPALGFNHSSAKSVLGEIAEASDILANVSPQSRMTALEYLRSLDPRRKPSSS